jgi:RNA polymerase sigma-70 factor (ECF subfamily)
MDFNIKSDNDLMYDFSVGREDAFREIVFRYKNKLYNYLLKGLIQDKDIAEDIVQETFIKVFKSKDKYKPIFQFSTWIYSICRNLALNSIRDNKKVLRLDYEYDDKEPVAIDDNAEVTLENEELESILDSIVSKLSANYREAVILRYLNNLSYKEIAKITGKNENTLKSLCKRAIEKIKEELKVSIGD